MLLFLLIKQEQTLCESVSFTSQLEALKSDAATCWKWKNQINANLINENGSDKHFWGKLIFQVEA